MKRIIVFENRIIKWNNLSRPSSQWDQLIYSYHATVILSSTVTDMPKMLFIVWNVEQPVGPPMTRDYAEAETEATKLIGQNNHSFLLAS